MTRQFRAWLWAMTIGLPLLATASATNAVAADEPVDLELILAVDISGSIDAGEAQLQRDGYVAALTSPEVIEVIQSGFIGRIALTYVEWAGLEHRWTVVGWRAVHDAASARDFAAILNAAPLSRGQRTSISGAIDFALPMFDGNGFEGTRRVIDISGDGPNNNGRWVWEARQTAIAAGVTINGLPIINNRPNVFGFPSLPDLDLYYWECVIGGPGAFIVVAQSFQDFAAAIRRKMILEIAGLRPPPPARPLLHYTAGSDRYDCNIGEQQYREFFQNLDNDPF